jgi:hypothetical protein
MAVAIRILGMTLIELLKHLDVAVRIEIIRLTSKIPTAEGKTPLLIVVGLLRTSSSTYYQYLHHATDHKISIFDQQLKAQEH